MNTREKSNQLIIEEILTNAIILDLAMASENDPYIVPMNFVYHNGRIYLHSSKTGTKMRYIKKNNQVCFLVRKDEELVTSRQPCSFGMRYRSVIGKGNISFVTDTEDKAEILSLFTFRYSNKKNVVFSPDSFERVCIICIEITSLSCKVQGYE